jgi:eukaryotic-like serine/threonine-protein kinase
MQRDVQVAGVREGEVLAGKYRIDKLLGAGGMGVVVAAHHLQLDERVALKFLLPEALGQSEAVARFVREARAAAKIKSEHVVRVSDVDTLPDGTPYIVMEYLEGGDLAGWLRQRGPLPVAQAVDFVLQACLAVAEAHRLGIVHRDLKPANLFCVRGPDGQPLIKVLDFGISKIAEGSGVAASMTSTTAVMGSPLYMSPEQMRSSKDVDHRTDIWALGVIVFQLLTDRTPFAGDSVADLAIRVATEPPPPLRSFRPDAPPELEAVIANCLQKDRRQRYANVAELALALAPFGYEGANAAAKSVVAILQGGESERTQTPFFTSSPAPIGTALATGTAPPVGRTSPTGPAPSKRAPSLAIAAAAIAVFLALAAAGGRWTLRRFAEPQNGTAAEAQGGASAGAAPSTFGVHEASSSPPTSSAAVTPAAASMPDRSTPAQLGRADPEPLDAGKGPVQGASPVAPVVRGEARTAHPVPPQRAPVPPAAECNPPYVVDSAGHRQYKPECP